MAAAADAAATITTTTDTATTTLNSPATTATASAVDALLKWKAKQSDSQNPQLLPQDDFIYLILTLKKIPQKGGINGARTNPNKIPLPHPIVSTTVSELCLIIDDRPNSNLTSEIAKKKIKSDGISVTKVIKLSKLKTDYKPFESKRKLCDSYDMFFADKRVITLLPKLLGKQFFRKKKLPLPVNLSHKNWKEQIERGCSSGLLFFSTGTCSVIRVAKVSMGRDEIVENVNAAIEGALRFVPKKLGGVRSFHLKFSDSVALPLYQSLPEIKLKIEGLKELGKGELDAGNGGSDKKKRKGNAVELGKKKSKKNKSTKGRIHEIDLGKDENEGDELGNNDVADTELDADEGGSDKKKRKGNAVELGKKKSKKNKSTKGRIHEIDLDKDENEGDEVENNDVVDTELDAVNGGSDKKKKKGNDAVELGKKSKKNKSTKGMIHEIDLGKDENQGDELENNDVVDAELDAVNGGSDKKKRKGNDAVELGKKSKKNKSTKGMIHEIDLGKDENEGDELGNNADDGGSDEKKRKGNAVELGKTKRSKKGKSVEVEEVAKADQVSEEAKRAKKSGKEKKRKGNVIEEDDDSTKGSDKVGKKKGKKQDGESGKKEKKKGRSVSNV